MTYALIQWGGLVAGQRPRSALAYVWSGKSKVYGESQWKADLINPDGTSRYKRPRNITRDDILVQFSGGNVPSPRLVADAKRELPIVEMNDSRFDLQDSLS